MEELKNTDFIVKTETSIHPIDEFVGGRIRLRRQMLKVSQEALANGLGITFQQVQKYESGANRVSASRLYMMARFLQVDVSYFFDTLESEQKILDYYKNEKIALPGVAEKRVEFDYSVNVSGAVRDGDVIENGNSVKTDPLYNNETLRLVSAYWKIKEEATRQKFLDLILSMSSGL